MKTLLQILSWSICLILLGQASINAQCTSNITLSSQEEVDSFPMNYGCTAIEGSLKIEGEDITNLDSLYLIESVEGQFKVEENPNLQSLNGLHNLTSIGGEFYIIGNISLLNLDGLLGLTSVGYNNNPFKFYIGFNDALQNIDGLSNLTNLDSEYVEITDNSSLQNIDGLSGITSISSAVFSVRIIDNDILQNIDGLSNITFIYSLAIRDNPLLENVDGLSGLTGYGISIYNNNSLQSIDGLINLEYVEALHIFNNPLLSDCCVIACLEETVIDYLNVENNAIGCNSETEIFDTCTEADCLEGGMLLSAKVYLQGAYDDNIGEMKTLLNEFLPLNQPFNTAPYNYTGTESVSNMPNNVVEWVLVEARTGTPSLIEKNTTVIETQVGLLLNTGEIVNVAGTGIVFTELTEGEAYHFCIRQKNHIDVLSANTVTAEANMSYDFTTAPDQAFGVSQQATLSNGKAALFVGDYNQDNIIQVTDFDAWFIAPAQLNVYSPLDGTMDGIIQVTDFDVWLPNKAKIGTPEIGF